MKKLFITSSLVTLILTSSAFAQSYNFSKDLGVGSTGADVVQLQSELISKGFHISSIESGLVSKGRFGSQTKVAVVAFQKANNISPHSGFVGPKTRVFLNNLVTNSTSTLQSVSVISTTTTGSTTVTVVGTVVGVSTAGVAGTLAASLWTTPSGVTAYKGQSYDLAGYKIQASASDMSVSSLSFDFDSRFWLYASALTVKDETGAVVGSISNLNASNFTELTVGSDYRVNVPVSNLVVKATQSKYLTLNATFLGFTDRATGNLNVIQAQIRAVDGTGVTDTETSTGGVRQFTYENNAVTTLTAVTSPNAPPIGFIEISSSIPTPNAVLGVFSLKSANATTSLKMLTVNIGIDGNGNTAGALQDLFSSIGLKVGDTVVGNGSINSITGVPGVYQQAQIVFSNLSASLPMDQYTDVSIIGTIAQDSNSRFEGIYATTTLDLTNPDNIDVEDSSYHRIISNSVAISGNIQQLTESLISLGGLPSVTYATSTNYSNLGTKNQQFVFSVPLMAGRNPIYISKDPYTAIGTSTNPTGITITPLRFSDDDSSGDSSTYFYLAPGQVKTFTVIYSASGPSIDGGIFQLTSLTYGTDTSAIGGFVYSPELTNILTAVLFH